MEVPCLLVPTRSAAARNNSILLLGCILIFVMSVFSALTCASGRFVRPIRLISSSFDWILSVICRWTRPWTARPNAPVILASSCLKLGDAIGGLMSPTNLSSREDIDFGTLSQLS